MPAILTELIEKVDNVELVRDEIAAILVVELAQQQALALAAAPPRDPQLWNLRVYSERANPLAEFLDAPEALPDARPIVNICLDNENVEGAASNTVERQKITAVFNIDCYGYAIAASDGAGHIPADEKAALEAQRAARLVRNILMAGAYTYLGHQGLVWKRWIQSMTVLRPPLDVRAVQDICAIRIAFSVEFNEFSPQVQGPPIALIAGEVIRQGTGQVLLRAHYEVPPPTP